MAEQLTTPDVKRLCADDVSALAPRPADALAPPHGARSIISIASEPRRRAFFALETRFFYFAGLPGGVVRKQIDKLDVSRYHPIKIHSSVEFNIFLPAATILPGTSHPRSNTSNWAC